MNRSQLKLGLIGVTFVITVILLFMVTGRNDSGERTVIQYPNGVMKLKFEAGWFWSWFGKTTAYNDLFTFDFDKNTAVEEATIDQTGIAVRYQDGGTGTIYGIARFSLPSDEETMLKLHRAFRTPRGLAYKLIKAVTEESNNLTAGLMTSEEAYTEKRGTFTEWSQEQIINGKFRTEIKEIYAEDETGQRVLKKVPQIKIGDDGLPMHIKGDLEAYGIEVTGYQITDWDFEDSTLEQISTKRKATMAIITAKAEAEQAQQEEITAEAKGKTAVMTAKYEKEVLKEQAVVEAEQAKEVAIIAAEQLVEVAAQALLEQEQKTLKAESYKEEQILLGEGDAEYKKLVLEADGALEQKIEAYITVNQMYAGAIAEQKWVPDLQFGVGSSGEGGQNAAQNLIDLFTAKTAKDLSLDMSIRGSNNVATPQPQIGQR